MVTIKLFLTSSAVENGGAFSGVIQMLWAFIEQLGKLLKYIPDIFNMLPWWLAEIVLIIFFSIAIPLSLKIFEFIKERTTALCDRLTKGSFNL